jgi:putative endonuclease
MPGYCYVLYSIEANRFYIGSSRISPDERLLIHLEKRYGGKSFTSQADDWEVFWSLPCNSIDQAKQIEKHLKTMKSRKYLQNLKKFPEMSAKLLSKYSPKKTIDPK